MDFLKEVHPGYSDDQIRLLMKETWERQLEYDPYMQFREREHTGKLVNIDKNGFRLVKNNGPWPPDPKNVNIFLFGGSGTFGYGIADAETIASHLQEYLAGRSAREAKVYNFGSGWFFSTQERARFMNLLAEGRVPDVAVFIDGLNDFYYETGEPEYTANFKAFMDGGRQLTKSSTTDEVLSLFPVKRLLDGLKARRSFNRHEEIDQDSRREDPSRHLVEILNRYCQNKRLIAAAAREYGVRPVFVWQPAPSYRYDMEYYLARKTPARVPPTIKLGYELMAETVKKNPKDFDRDFLWLADIQEQCKGKGPLYVDLSHYTDTFCNIIAGHIGQYLLDRQVIAGGNTLRQPLPGALASSEERDGR
jgi:hypothetical protein